MSLDNDILQDEHSDLRIVEEDKSPSCTSTPIPLHQTPGSQLLSLQKQLRDELAKCSTVPGCVSMPMVPFLLLSLGEKINTSHNSLQQLEVQTEYPTQFLHTLQVFTKCTPKK